MSTQYKKPPKLLPQEYASYRPDVIKYLVQKIPKRVTLLDPMAGSAPLLPFAEASGRSSHFCDLLPVHFYLNSAKTVDVYTAYRRRKQRSQRFLIQLASSLLRPLANAGLSVSDDWLHKDIVDALCESWAGTLRYSTEIRKLLRASIVLSIRHFSSFSTSSNTTWMKAGGIYTGANIDTVAQYVSHRIEEYYKRAYTHSSTSTLPSSSSCTIHSGNVNTLMLKRRKYVVVSSPSFANRYDYVQAYFPELLFLHRAALCPDPSALKDQILSSNKVTDFEATDDVLSLVQSRSPSAYKFVSTVRTSVPMSRIRKENDYYFRYFLRYYFDLFRYLDNVDQYTRSGSEFLLVVQTNMHRGEVNNVDQFLVEYFRNCGFESDVVQSWTRSHQGRRNISRHHPLVVGKHRESVVWAKKVAQ